MQETKIGQSDEPKSFKLYKGKAPLALQIIGGLMWLGGLGSMFQGIPLLLFFGVGIVPIVLGILTIKYARGIFKMEKRAYKGTMVLTVLGVFGFFIGFFINGFKFSQTVILEITGVLLYTFVIFYYLKKYKNQFVN